MSVCLCQRTIGKISFYFHPDIVVPIDGRLAVPLRPPAFFRHPKAPFSPSELTTSLPDCDLPIFCIAAFFPPPDNSVLAVY